MPRIGLLSDSHGRAATTRRAVDLLLAQGAELLLHLGDVGGTQVIDALAVESPAAPGTQVEARLVFGNTDWDAAALATYARHLGIHVDHPAGHLDVEGGHLVFCHGHQPDVLDRAVAQGARYLCHGHTHRTLDVRRGPGPTRIINPGALFRARIHTVALLDTAGDELRVYPVPDSG